ncbi:MAG: PilZ domain-containing protein [Candidatus Omnitrophota bacterium]|nr:MAG: PilZ domain-containing protein [Candidatus Omnitrophota bacterium]
MDFLKRNLNKRKFERVKARFVVSCNMDRSLEMHMWVGNREIDALMLDLSQEGMAILAKYDIPKATVLSIKFTLINVNADEDRVRSMEIVGRVRYSISSEKKEYKLGISFIRISKRNKEAIANFVKSEMDR